MGYTSTVRKNASWACHLTWKTILPTRQLSLNLAIRSLKYSACYPRLAAQPHPYSLHFLLYYLFHYILTFSSKNSASLATWTESQHDSVCCCNKALHTARSQHQFLHLCFRHFDQSFLRLFIVVLLRHVIYISAQSHIPYRCSDTNNKILSDLVCAFIRNSGSFSLSYFSLCCSISFGSIKFRSICSIMYSGLLSIKPRPKFVAKSLSCVVPCHAREITTSSLQRAKHWLKQDD